MQSSSCTLPKSSFVMHTQGLILESNIWIDASQRAGMSAHGVQASLNVWAHLSVQLGAFKSALSTDEIFAAVYTKIQYFPSIRWRILCCCFCGFKAQQCLDQRYGLKTLSTTRKPPFLTKFGLRLQVQASGFKLTTPILTDACSSH